MGPPGVLEIQPERIPVPDCASTLLGHARIVADRNRHCLERELKNVVHCVEGGRNRNVGLPRLLGRKERDERINEWRDKPATIMFPIHAEACAMRAALPGERIVEMEAPAEIVGDHAAPDLEAGLWDGDVGSADAEASGAILLGRGRFAGTDEEVGKAENLSQGDIEKAEWPAPKLSFASGDGVSENR
jgi:hypothetical protein